MNEVRMSLEEARALAFRCLSLNGCDEANAGAVADNMTLAERDICPSSSLACAFAQNR